MDVPVGLSVELVVGGMVEKITRYAKLSRRSEVREEKMANCGPSAFSPGTLAVGG